MKIQIELHADNLDREQWQRDFDKRQDLYGLLQTITSKVFEQIDREPSVCKHPEAADVLRDKNGNIIGTLVVEI